MISIIIIKMLWSKVNRTLVSLNYFSLGLVNKIIIMRDYWGYKSLEFRQKKQEPKVSLKTGDVIVSSEPFAFIVEERWRGLYCGNCLLRGGWVGFAVGSVWGKESEWALLWALPWIRKVSGLHCGNCVVQRWVGSTVGIVWYGEGEWASLWALWGAEKVSDER